MAERGWAWRGIARHGAAVRGLLLRAWDRLFGVQVDTHEYLPAQPTGQAIVDATDAVDEQDDDAVKAPWTLSDFLDRLHVFTTIAKAPVLALYGHSNYLDKDGWHAIKRIVTHFPAWDEAAYANVYKWSKEYGWPSYGSISLVGKRNCIEENHAEDRCTIPSWSFIKHDALPWYVKGPPGIPYEVIVRAYVTKGVGPDEPEGSIPARYFVVMDPETGRASPCQFFNFKPVTTVIPRGRKHRPATAVTRIERQWTTFEDAFMGPEKPGDATYKSEKEKAKNWTHLLPWVLNAWTQRAREPVVVVSKGYIRLSINVQIEQCKSFFRDRGVTVTKSGRRAPILHWVRAHGKKQRDGRVIPTRMHFRGERNFKWKGWDVAIVFPGLHAPESVLDGAAAHEYPKGEEPNIPMTTAREVIDMMSKYETGRAMPTLAERRRNA